MTQTQPHEDVPPKRPAPLWQRLLLAAGSVLATALLLEGATRLLVPPPAPVALQEGVYVTQLPLVTGRDTVAIVHGQPLPEQKRPGEIRVFVFGESSVEGGPWGYAGSPVTMLHDHLRARFPDRDVTVVNMGRGAATTLDAYYFLVSIERFAPDFVVFYQGGNDFFNVERERCLPADHPVLYAGYRALVERSRFLWTARALGPALLVRRFPPPKGQPDREGRPDLCDPQAGFRAWTDVLVSTARKMGAQVIVTTPVENPLRWPETEARWGVDRPLSISGESDAYRRILACVLTDGCDLVETFRREQRDQGWASRWEKPRGAAWRAAAGAAGAKAVDFAAYVDDRAASGLRPALFAEEVHLSLEGYWWLSWLWSEQLGALLGGGAFDAAAAGLPPAFPAERYLASVARGSPEVEACVMLRCADVLVRANLLLIAASLLRSAVALDVDGPGGAAASPAGRNAQLLVGRLRQELGMDPGLPPALRAEIEGRSLDDLGKRLRDVPDCRSIVPRAGPAELALVAPLVPGALLAGWKVSEVDAVRDGVLRIVVERGSERVDLQVALADPGGPNAPATAGRYAAFYTTRGSDDAEGVRLAVALAAVIQKNGAAPTPPGMTPMKNDEGPDQGPAPAGPSTR